MCCKATQFAVAVMNQTRDSKIFLSDWSQPWWNGSLHSEKQCKGHDFGDSGKRTGPAKTAEPISMPCGVWSQQPSITQGVRGRHLANTTEYVFGSNVDCQYHYFNNLLLIFNHCFFLIWFHEVY